MESTRSKLNILFSPGFLAILCDQIENARLNLDDDMFLTYNIIRKNLFRFSSERSIRSINGREVSEEEFNKVYADLRMIPTSRKQASKLFDTRLELIPSRETILLLNTSDIDSKIKAKELGVMVSAPGSIVNDYNTLTFDNKFNMPFQIKATDKKETPFDYQKAFTPFKIPINKVVLLDPYLYSSDDETIKINLVELISALFTGKDPNNCPSMKIKIITTFPKEFKPRDNILPEIAMRKSRILGIKSLLDRNFKTFEKVIFNVVCIDLFELNKENSEIRKIEIKGKQEKQNIYLSDTQRKTKELFRFCRNFIHDRWFFTNYYVCDSGRGFSPLVRNKLKEVYVPYWSKMNLFSQLQKEHFLNCRKLESELLKLESNKNDLELNKYFYSF